MLYSCILVQTVVVAMLVCMLYAMWTNENGDYTPNIAHSYAVWIVKFPCAVALHFFLYPEVANGMNIMKFANQQCDLFVPYGSEISFILGLISVSTALLCEFVNIYMLAYQHTVQHCIIHFVALEVIMEISNMYFESLKSNKLKEIMHHAPKYVKCGHEIKFTERSLFHKFARILYKVLRCFYVSVIFYFVPFSVLYLQWITIADAPAHH